MWRFWRDLVHENANLWSFELFPFVFDHVFQSVLLGVLEQDKSNDFLYSSFDNEESIICDKDFHAKVNKYSKWYNILWYYCFFSC